MNVIIKKRRFHLISPISPEDQGEIVTALKTSDGVLNAAFNTDSTLTVSYDLGRVDLTSIETVIQVKACNLSKNVFRRFLRGWVLFAEENEKSNRRSVPRSCCDVPKR